MRRMLALLLVIAFVFTFTACQSENTTKATETQKETTKKTELEVKNVELLTWSNAPTVNYFKSLTEGFAKANPGHALVVTDVPDKDYQQVQQTRAAAGNVDIFCFQFFGERQEEWNKNFHNKPLWQQFVDEGLLLDLSGYDFMKKYTEKALADNRYKEKNFCVPTATVVYNGLIYNKKIFKELNLKIPETWDEFISLCETVKSSGKYGVITTGGGDQWPLIMFGNGILSAIFPEEEAIQIGKGLVTGEIKHTDEKLLKLYDCLDQFSSYLEPGFAGIPYQDVPAWFVQGKTAMLATGIYQAPYITAVDPEFEFGYFPLPGLTKRSDGLPPQYAGKYDLTFTVAAKAPNQEGALKFLDYFSQKETYSKYLDATGFMPTQPGITSQIAYMNELAPNIVKTSIHYDFLGFDLKGVGEYGANHFNMFYLKGAGGPLTGRELAQLADDDYQKAFKALGR